MRLTHFTLPAALFVTAACVEQASAPIELPKHRLTATVTSDNHCTVNVMGKTYSSIGQVRGDVPSQFIGTIPDESYHGFGCWVSTDDGDGDLIVIFSGNNLGKPLEVGQYAVQFNVYDETPRHIAAVNFRPSSLGGERLRTRDNSVGTVTVSAAPDGGRTITVDVETSPWGAKLF